MIADIATGKTGGADIAFLIAVIAFAFAVIVLLMSRRVASATDIPVATTLAYIGMGCVAFGLMLL